MKQKTRILNHTILEKTVRDSVKSLTGSGEEYVWIHRLSEQVKQYKVIGINKDNLPSQQDLPDNASMHGEMIIMEYLLEHPEELDELNKKSAGSSNTSRVLRIGGTKLDCATCNAHFFGGPVKRSGKKTITKAEKAGQSSAEPEKENFQPYSGRLKDSKGKEILVRSRGTSGEAFEYVYNLDEDQLYINTVVQKHRN